MSKPTQVLPHLFLGGKTEAKSKSVLESLKIKYILNCTPSRNLDKQSGCPNFFEKEQAFKYLRIPIFDNRGEDILAHFESAFKFIEEGKYYGGVLVHCLKGVSRSASFVIAYLMKFNEMTLDEALSYVQSVRPIIAPNESFIQQLQQYEQTLQKQQQQQRLKQESHSHSHSNTETMSHSSYDVQLPSSSSSSNSSIAIGLSSLQTYDNNIKETSTSSITTSSNSVNEREIVAPTYVTVESKDINISLTTVTDINNITEMKHETDNNTQESNHIEVVVVEGNDEETEGEDKDSIGPILKKPKIMS